MSKKILLIDDERDTVQIMQRQIQERGYEVLLAYNGKEGLESAKKNRPHVIVLDLAMPFMNGFDFYMRMKEDPSLSDVMVIVASAFGENEARMRALGVHDFLVKPFSTHQLLSRILAVGVSPS